MSALRRPDLAIGGFTVEDRNAEDLALELDRSLELGRKNLLLFANAHFVVKCQHLRDQIAALPVTVVNDGLGMRIASLVLYGRSFLANLNGSDFLPWYFRRRTTVTRVFLLGSSDDEARGAARALAGMPNIVVVGIQDGFTYRERGVALLADINASGADVLLVGMGNPLQEEWILTNAQAVQVPLIIGVGAFFIWLSGQRKRAPALVRRLHPEWAHRLLQEPRRLMWRYTVGIVHFAAICMARRNDVGASEPLLVGQGSAATSREKSPQSLD